MKANKLPPLSEAQVQKTIIEFCEWKKIPIFRCNAGGNMRTNKAGKTYYSKSLPAGFPDLIVIHKGTTLYCEIKAIKGVQSDDQVAMQAVIESGGGVYHVIRSIEEFEELLGHYT